MPLLLPLVTIACQKSALEFDVKIPDSLPKAERQGPVSVVIYLSQSEKNPMYGPNWFHPEPCYSAKFSSVSGQTLRVTNENAIGFPGRLAKLEPGSYTVQAVIDRNLGGREIARSPGNYYSDSMTLNLDPSISGKIPIECPNKVEEPRHVDEARLKFVRFQSTRLTKWYGRPTFVKAAVALPDDYSSTDHRYPVVYEIPGFGGSSDNEAEAREQIRGTLRNGHRFIDVLLDPNVPTGHCVFADSANNGPWGSALVDEFIPFLEARFRMKATPSTRFLRGHSSGGWSSLWLQVSHPQFFGGVWSTSPDPVDFTDFQRINLYQAGENMFKDRDGQPRPLARDGEHVLAYYQPFSDMERPIRGEQLGSFEAVFSPRGADGNPEQLWDRNTGNINQTVAEYWRKFDIDLILKNHWAKLGPELAGKIHVFCGTEDTFYLDGAVRKLRATLAGLKSDAQIEMLPGNHFTVLTEELQARIDQGMVAKLENR